MRYLFLLLSFIVTICTGQDNNTTETKELTLVNGRIRGSTMTSRLGKKIYSFRGLRYAEAPIGERRFKPAAPIVPWTDVFDATQEGPSCPQPGGINQSEDCLRLNVYTTKLPSADRKGTETSKKPVIVFYHMGAFFASSGQSLAVGPNYFMDQDIVLVTVNYRLGSLGFLSTGDAVAPGNLGLKDQVESLRWIQKNIAEFGGDPNCVTITGYSAGSWSVGLHLLSPMSKGLFHRAIASSGSAIYQTPLQPHQMNLAKKQAQFLNCPSNTSTEIVECLKTKNATDIGATLPQFFEWQEDPAIIWTPVVEPEIPGVERFLMGQPSDLIREGKIHHVPFITGIDKDEFGGIIVPFVEAARAGDMSVFNDLNENWTTIAPISFCYERSTTRSVEISTALKQFYLNGQPVSLDNYEGLGRLYADAIIIFGVNNYVKLFAQASKAPVYFYEFTYQGRYSHAVWNDTKKPYGVNHGDLLLYLFWDSHFPYFERNAPEFPTVVRMITIWAHFAKTGEPIPCENPKFVNVTWTPFTLEKKNYLQIGKDLVMKTNLYRDRMMLWESLFPIPGVA